MNQNNPLKKQDAISIKPNVSGIELRLPKIDGEGLATYKAGRMDLVHDKPELFTAFKMMIENTRDAEIGDTEAAMLREAMRRDGVKVFELNEAFWKAYKDKYTPKEGIQWRHLWKHIQEFRQNSYEQPQRPE